MRGLHRLSCSLKGVFCLIIGFFLFAIVSIIIGFKFVFFVISMIYHLIDKKVQEK